MNLPDIHIVTLDERLEGLIVPSKFVGVIALGRPVLWIGAANGEVGSLVNEFGCGMTVPPGDIPALTRALHELYDDYVCGGARCALCHPLRWSYGTGGFGVVRRCTRGQRS